MTSDKSHPYIKFYGRDWLGDTMLRMCTSEERGVWIDIMCVMMSGEPYGHLSINNKAMTDAEVSRIIGIDEQTFKGILYRLEERGIPSRTESGILFSRRLVREHHKFIACSEAGKRGGGNPRIKKNTKARSHIPEAKGSLKVSFKPTFKGVVESGNMPKCLDSEHDFGIAWDSWVEFRAEKRKKLTRKMVLSQLKFLSEMGKALAIESIEQSIRNGWQGLFEVKQSGFKKQEQQSWTSCQ
jgi:hypothetical protein